MDDVRYSELVFLRELAAGSRHFEHFCTSNPEQTKAVGLSQTLYIEMAITLLEELCVRFDDQEMQTLVYQLRGELASDHKYSRRFHEYQWTNPRTALRDIFLPGQPLQQIRITYKGLRRIEELRDLLRRDRILEPFGVLLDLRYLRKDLEDALRRGSDVPVSVLSADLDDFKPINTQFGYAAGDVVMKGYLEVVRDSLGVFGLVSGAEGMRSLDLWLGKDMRALFSLHKDSRSNRFDAL